MHRSVDRNKQYRTKDIDIGSKYTKPSDLINSLIFLEYLGRWVWTNDIHDAVVEKFSDSMPLHITRKVAKTRSDSLWVTTTLLVP